MILWIYFIILAIIIIISLIWDSSHENFENKKQVSENILGIAYEDEINDLRQVNLEMEIDQNPIPPDPSITTIPSTKKPHTLPPTNCTYKNWSAWTACSNRCGIGIQTAKRTVNTDEKNGGSCDRTNSALTKTQPCYSTLDCQGTSSVPIDDLTNGLFFMVYNGYHAEDPSNILVASKKLLSHAPDKRSYTGISKDFTNIGTSTNGNTIPNGNDSNFSIIWSGYLFTKNEIGTWNFWVTCKDGGYMWLGDYANNGYDISNAVIQNGGIRTSMIEKTYTVSSLQQNTYYPIRIMYGQTTGKYDFQFYFQSPNMSKRQSISQDYFFTLLPSPIDCVYSDWSDWSTCTQSCSGGLHTRTRTIMFDEVFGGKCDRSQNNLTDTSSCNTQPCPIDCSYTWSDWNACDPNTGTQFSNPITTILNEFGGENCPTKRTRNCDIDCSYIYSDWDYCNLNSGMYTRTVHTSPPVHDGSKCQIVSSNQLNQSCLDNLLFNDFSKWNIFYNIPGIKQNVKIFVDNLKNNKNGFQIDPIKNEKYLCVKYDKSSNFKDLNVYPIITLQTTIILKPGYYKFTYYIQSSLNANDAQNIAIYTTVNGTSNDPFYFFEKVKPGIWVPQVIIFKVDESYDIINHTKPITTIQFSFVLLDINSNFDNTVALSGVKIESCGNNPCPIDCQYGWTDCDNSGNRNLRVFVPSSNNGKKCPADIDTTTCPLDCSFTWSPYSTCDKTYKNPDGSININYGTYFRDPIVKIQSKNGGVKCPPREIIKCPVDCSYSWPKEWSVLKNENTVIDPNDKSNCGVSTGTHYKDPLINLPDINNGNKCPTRNTEKCRVDCQYTWGNWSTCNKNDGTQYRDPIITSQPKNGGTACPGRQTQYCDVNCEYNWSNWSTCDKNSGTQYSDPIVSIQPKHNGTACPGRQTQKCDVNCEGDWNVWSGCSAPCGGGTQFRDWKISVPQKNNGAACPGRQYQNCNQQRCIYGFNGSENKSTNWDSDGNVGNTVYLDRHTVDCGGRGLQGIKLVDDWNSNKWHYEYKCANNAKYNDTTSKSTPVNELVDGGGKAQYLDRHNLDCGNNSVINKFHLQRNNDNNAHYDYGCSNTYNNLSCRTVYTPWTSSFGGNMAYLGVSDAGNMQCNSDEAISQFKMETTGGDGKGAARYQYKCCKAVN